MIVIRQGDSLSGGTRRGPKVVVETFRHEDNALAQRTDWFLIFHAILLEAYFAAVDKKPVYATFAIALFGFTCAFLWLAAHAMRSRFVTREIAGGSIGRYHRVLREPRPHRHWCTGARRLAWSGDSRHRHW